MKKLFALILAMVMCMASPFFVSLGEEQSATDELRITEDLTALKNAEYPFDGAAKAFALKYANQTITVDGFIYDADFGSLWRDVEIQIGDRETAKSVGPSMMLAHVKPEDLGATGSDFPAYLQYGTNVRVTGVVEKYDDWDDCIVLKLISMEPRNPFVDGLEIGVYASLGNGAKGDDVKVLQQRLIDLYYLDGAADGKYGKITKAAVEKFQTAINVEATGIADPTTQAVLFSDRAPKAELTISCSSVVVGSNATTSWYVDGQTFTLKGKNVKTINTRWGKYKFDAYGNYEKLE